MTSLSYYTATILPPAALPHNVSSQFISFPPNRGGSGSNSSRAIINARNTRHVLPITSSHKRTSFPCTRGSHSERTVRYSTSFPLSLVATISLGSIPPLSSVHPLVLPLAKVHGPWPLPTHPWPEQLAPAAPRALTTRHYYSVLQLDALGDMAANNGKSKGGGGGGCFSLSLLTASARHCSHRPSHVDVGAAVVPA